MSSPDNLALYERERLEPPAGDNMLERYDKLVEYILALQDDRKDLSNLSLRNLPEEMELVWKIMRDMMLDYYDAEQQNKALTLKELQTELIGMGYAV